MQRLRVPDPTASTNSWGLLPAPGGIPRLRLPCEVYSTGNVALDGTTCRLWKSLKLILKMTICAFSTPKSFPVTVNLGCAVCKGQPTTGRRADGYWDIVGATNSILVAARGSGFTVTTTVGGCPTCLLRSTPLKGFTKIALGTKRSSLPGKLMLLL